MRVIRLLVFAMVLGISYLTFSISTEALQPNDPNEPNDDGSTATSVQIPFSAMNLLINPSGDRDVFQFILDEKAQVEIAVTADQVGSTLDPVMALLSADGELINQSDDVRGLDPVILAELEAGSYFVVVEGFFGLSTGFYDLEILAQSLGDCLESELQSNEIESWSLGRLGAGARIQVLLLGPQDADFDLALVEVISESPHIVATVDSSFSTTSQERVNYRVQGEGTREFIAQANSFSGTGPYMLCVSTEIVTSE